MTKEGWVLEHTLGGRAKEFYWRIDDQGNIYIKRKFRNMKRFRIDELSVMQLELLDEYLSDGEWKALANNVAKLWLGKEKEGIGRFMYENFGLKESIAQLSSHLAAIFYKAGVWLHNGRKKNMEFKRITDNWIDLVKNYYSKRLIDKC